MLIPVDVLANYKSRFEWRSTQPTIERRIAKTHGFPGDLIGLYVHTIGIIGERP